MIIRYFWYITSVQLKSPAHYESLLNLSRPFSEIKPSLCSTVAIKTSCWPCCCVSPIVHGPLSMTPLLSHWIPDFWLAEPGLLCRHSPSAHSSADLGVVLRISFAAGPISPFTNSAREKIERIRVSFCTFFATFFVQLLTRPFAVIFGLIHRLGAGRLSALSTWIFWGGSLRSLFIHLIGWVPLLHQKAWEHKSPKPLEKMKLR